MKEIDSKKNNLYGILTYAKLNIKVKSHNLSTNQLLKNFKNHFGK